MPQASPAPAVPGVPRVSGPLSQLDAGALARVVSVDSDDDDAIRLKSLGICIGRRVQLAKIGDPLIVRVLGTRVGLSARLARCVVVELL